MVKCHKIRYDFQTATAEDLIHIIQDQVRLFTDGAGFESIAVACHGPPEQKERAKLADMDNLFHWEISKNIQISASSEFIDQDNAVRKVMLTLAASVVEGANVMYGGVLCMDSTSFPPPHD
jgi:hypothetical protein